MKKTILVALAMVMVGAAAVALGGVPVLAECVPTSIIRSSDGSCNGVEVGENGEGIFVILNTVLDVMTFGVGVLATIGVMISGYRYLTAKDDASKVQKAKDRLVQIVIGLGIYAIIWTVLQFLLPGGLFGDGS